MALLDRFRARPAWQSPDPQVRAAAVRQLGADQSDLLASIARDDADPRVRRTAVQRLEDPTALAERARSDGDESVRQEATDRLLHLAEAAEDPATAEAAPPLPAEPPPPPEPPISVPPPPAGPIAAPVPDARERERSERLSLCEKVESLQGEDALDRLEEARAAWEGMAPLIDPPDMDA